MLARMIRALKLDKTVFEEVEHDQSATGQAALVVVIVAVISGLGAILNAGIMAVVGGIIMSLVMWVIWSVATWAIGTMLLGGRATLGEMMRTLGFAYTPGVFGVIPYIGWLIAFVWTLAAFIVAIRQGLDFSTGKAIATAVLALVVVVIAMIPLAMLLAMLGLGAGLATGSISPS